MKKLLWGGLMGLLFALAAQAGDVLKLKEGHPQTYVVERGDTLWDISSMFLNDPWLWPQLWHHNPQIENPHLIYPGDRLNLVWIDGQPRLVLARGGDVKWTPAMRSTPIDQAIPAIPLEAVNAFLTRGRVVAEAELSAAPYILAGKEGHIITGAGDEVYARGDLSSHTVWGVVRRGQAFVDPDTNELLGVEARDIGSAKRLSNEGDVATLALNRSTEEVRRGDRLLPEEERRINASFFPSAPATTVDGYLLSVEGGVSQIGRYNVVVINKGAREGLTEGNLLAIYRAGELVRDPVTNEMVKTPDFRAGLLMVFRVFERVSYGLVLRAERPLAVNDRVRNP
ncbi:MAG: LysM peptidoglycan-binding domain-containing protein [Spongiibacteraceae bacterium]|jgi:hypothetical protein|nr:LysM peptidoglycan-binding domain-containing protein [Spongiibacteraceae bacterium]